MMISITKKDKEKIENYDTQEIIKRWGLYNGCKVTAFVYDDSLEFSDEEQERIASGEIEIIKIGPRAFALWFRGYFDVDIFTKKIPLLVPLYEISEFKKIKGYK